MKRVRRLVSYPGGVHVQEYYLCHLYKRGDYLRVEQYNHWWLVPIPMFRWTAFTFKVRQLCD